MQINARERTGMRKDNETETLEDGYAWMDLYILYSDDVKYAIACVCLCACETECM